MPKSNGAHNSLIGCTIGNRYTVERLIGTGGMGAVYCARLVELDTLVAVKVLHPRLAAEPGLVKRFEREAFATSRLDHPNTLRVLDFGQDGELLYLVTEYVEAADLLAIMEAEWPLDDDRVASILSQLLSALVAVHGVGIVHRDLKPENILVLKDKNDDGVDVDVVKLCDFGIAKVARQSLFRTRPFAPRLTAEGVVVGTPHYMSPEQARGQPVDARSDLYSVGVVLYHLLAGRTPFDADTAIGLGVQHVSEIPVPPSDYRPVHAGLEAVCLRALSKRPEDRFQTSQEMRRAVRDAMTRGSAAMALVPAPLRALRVGSNFSTSSAAMLTLRPLPAMMARPRYRYSERRRRHLAIGYAAAISVAAITASAFVASRRSGRDEPAHAAQEVQRVTALVSPPRYAADQAPVSDATADARSDAEESLALVTSAAAMTMPAEPPRRRAAKRRPPPAPKNPPRKLVIAIAPPALPASPPEPKSNSPLLVRDEPWPSPGIALEASQRAASLAEPREVTQATPVPPAALTRQERAPVAPTSGDASGATVHLAGVATSAGISGAKVKVTLSHVPLSACYEWALRARPTEGPFDAELRLTIDVDGLVVNGYLSRDANLPGLRTCIEGIVRGAQIRDVDTGDGSATVQLKFVPR